MSQRSTDGNQLIISYLFLRKTVGWIGGLLPIVLFFGNLIFFTTPRPDSMSGYYYTHMRDVFVGALCALGVFLVAYAGYDEVDRWITNIAGIGALGVALFPTKPTVCTAHAGVCPAASVTHLSTGQQVAGGLHLFFAAVTLIALAVMALRFAKAGITPPGGGLMDQIRNGLGLAERAHLKWDDVVYRACGFTISSCVVLAALSNLLPASVNANVPLLFIFEAIAVFAFGFSWFVKGRTMTGVLSRFRPGMRAAEPWLGEAIHA